METLAYVVVGMLITAYVLAIVALALSLRVRPGWLVWTVAVLATVLTALVTAESWRLGAIPLAMSALALAVLARRSRRTRAEGSGLDGR